MRLRQALLAGLLTTLALAAPSHAVITSDDMTWTEVSDSGDAYWSGGGHESGGTFYVAANTTISGAADANGNWTEYYVVQRVYHSNGEVFHVDIEDAPTASVWVMGSGSADAYSEAYLHDSHATPTFTYESHDAFVHVHGQQNYASISCDVKAITSATTAFGTDVGSANADAYITMNDAELGF